MFSPSFRGSCSQASSSRSSRGSWGCVASSTCSGQQGRGRTQDRRLQPQGEARLRDPRTVRDGHRADRLRGQIAPRGPGLARRGVRARSRRRGVDRGDARPAVRAGDGQTHARPHPAAQAAAAPRRDRASRRQDRRTRIGARAASRVLRTWSGQAGARPRARETSVREASGDRGTRAPPGDAPRGRTKEVAGILCARAERNLVLRTAARIVGASVVTLALVACGNGDGDGEETVSTQTYAQRLCANMQSYIDEVAMQSTDFAGELDPAAELDEQRDALLAFLDDVLVATDRLIAGIERAGVPDVDDGGGGVAAVEKNLAGGGGGPLGAGG